MNNYPRIIFNKRRLPEGAIFIDYCASGNFFDNIDEDLSKWFWKFTNCVGLNCSEESVKVVQYASKLKSMLLIDIEAVKKKLKDKYEPKEADQIIEWWIESLNIMIETANKRKVSNWIGEEVDEENEASS